MTIAKGSDMKTATAAKGQIYSLDFLIAAGLLVLALGMLLNYFETAAYEGKEARTKNELTAIALTASNLLLSSNLCPDNSVSNPTFLWQGYKAYGCYNEPALRGNNSTTKAQLLMPAKFSCSITLNGSAITDPTAGCRADPEPGGASPSPAPPQDIGSVERKFLSTSPGILAKNIYEKCIAGFNCPAYTENTLVVRVWLT